LSSETFSALIVNAFTLTTAFCVFDHVSLVLFNVSHLGGVMVSVLDILPKVRGFKPAKMMDFKGNKNPQRSILQRGRKSYQQYHLVANREELAKEINFALFVLRRFL
jgi:hypothetical protein